MCQALVVPGSDPAAVTNGVPQNGHPTWAERTFHVLLNAVREAPAAYRTKYTAPTVSDGTSANIFAGGAGLSPHAPVMWNAALAAASLFFAQDRANCNTRPTQGTLCDGTAWPTWALSLGLTFSPLAFMDSLGEPVTLAAPQDVLTTFLCDSPGGNSNCATDGSALHRTIAVSDALVTGVGVATGTFWSSVYAVQFASTGPTLTPIPAGSHFFVDNQIRFALNVWDAAAPTVVAVVIDGTSHPMVVDIGTATVGLYAYSEGQSAGAVCRSYYFQYQRADGSVWRYPSSGSLRTYGEGGCTEMFVP